MNPISVDALSSRLSKLNIDPVHYGTASFKKGDRISPRYHPVSRIIAVLDGAFQLTADGQTTAFKKYDLAIIPANTLYEAEMEQATSLVLIDFTADHNSAYEDLDTKYRFSSPQIYHGLLDQRQLDNLKHLSTTAEKHYPGCYLLIQQMIVRIFIVAMLYREQHNLVPILPKRTSSHEVVLHECIALIEAHISEPLKVNDLAAMMNYTPNYLYKIFEELLHVSCKQFILQYKLNRSLYLLKSTEDSVQSISSQLAFSSLYHFSAVFKGEYGISPLRYRHSVKKPVTYPF